MSSRACPATRSRAPWRSCSPLITLATLGGLILLALTTTVMIRYSLRPLRAVAGTATRVANQPLDRGEVEITERVPASEADPRTETGMVGASLNTLRDHVNDSLAARQRNEELMRKFVADASHELRTPLASIRGYSELSLRALSQGADASGTETALERIQAQSLRNVAAGRGSAAARPLGRGQGTRARHRRPHPARAGGRLRCTAHRPGSHLAHRCS